ncbi:MAG TPA: hypothetical protein VFX70_14900 [Mycobacteriales bacterium]|nr:hypothetical protein [Mycobacteriales bacterium]
MSVREDLHRQPARVAVALVAAAVVVLVVRLVALVVVLVADLTGRAVALVAVGAGAAADGLERAEGRLSGRAGVLPLGSRVVVLAGSEARAGGAQ